MIPSGIDESPDSHAIVRAAIEQALREFVFFTSAAGIPARKHFVDYLQGRFSLDKALVERLPL